MKGSFFDELRRFDCFDFSSFLENARRQDVERALLKDSLGELDFLTLLSRNALGYLEPLAQKAREYTLANFGKVILLYTPLYISNYCDNDCLYCGFKYSNVIQRRKLSVSEVEREAQEIAKSGIRHVLLLTGESKEMSPVSYIQECIQAVSRYFSSVGIEIYPLTEEEYVGLSAAGADGLTLYQETYDRDLYSSLHSRGPKSDYRFRLDAPQRAAVARMRQVNVGALLGLGEFQKDVFLAGLHGRWLQNNYPEIELGISFPRLQPHTGDFICAHPLTDQELVQSLIAMRLFLPRAGIAISTRENSALRKNLIGLGVTRMSAGSRTQVGGYALDATKEEGQFEIADTSSVDQVKKMIAQKGYQPVCKDWQA
ncbi:MAG: 2-iminoacetate synthase ThiH [Candidatus Omnitrophica bacterium]|nr:2-iminoacetate synthase ThiH [Candidatus Omnitrophota bacterium]MBU4303811.1 2-iminoacetate synthase ThiH [Candidatus Omnitrophota bacterium]MBU4468002.1 2-iminoacetate synthase ThiH [Candidatus Omnitrophota bacterium]MCG2707799.1 2-iminoacetate synthase ThiH [Candidatus Omnitrophota bacterium]